jgi:hypothetical protein
MQFNLRDVICMLSLHAVVIGGIAHRMRELPKETDWVHRVAIASPMQGFADVTERVQLNWYSVLVGGIVGGSATIVAAFIAVRLLLNKARSHIRQSAARIAAALACVAVVAAFWLLGMAVLYGNYSQVFDSELGANLSEAAHSRGVIVAAFAAAIVVVLECVSCFRSVRR